MEPQNKNSRPQRFPQRLKIGGCDAGELAETHGTPLICYDEAIIRDNCKRYIASFARNGNRVAYAGKAFLCLAMCQIVAEEGLYLDVVSGGELYTALQAGFPAEKIYFHGNNKSRDELTMAVTAGVGCIVVDNTYEYQNLREVARASRSLQPVSILLRVAVGVDAATHPYVMTGHFESKFGLSLGSQELDSLVADALNEPSLTLMGFHSHIGSQITDSRSFTQAVDALFAGVRRYLTLYQWSPPELNLGGGLGVPYTADDKQISIEEHCALLLNTAQRHMDDLNFTSRLTVEPGRSIVGPAGTTLYRVGAIKRTPNGRCFVNVDGGMADNPRVALYQAKYTCSVADQIDQPGSFTYTVAGKACESGDILIWDHPLPEVQSGDILAVNTTGAYTYSMASNYNRLPRPAVVLAKDGEAKLIIARETYSDLTRLDRPK
ncbi:MAG: Diaminopimelate decarboxylase [Firmicutes bacterium]|nr:Diaminopimelate decarboxylase [candidate division NPL-UPA2 bacterium]